MQAQAPLLGSASLHAPALPEKFLTHMDEEQARNTGALGGPYMQVRMHPPGWHAGSGLPMALHSPAWPDLLHHRTSPPSAAQ